MDQRAQMPLLFLRVPADDNALLKAVQNMGDKRPASASLELIETITEYCDLRLAVTSKEMLTKAFTLALPLAKQLPWASHEFKVLISEHGHHWKFEDTDTGESTVFAEPLMVDVINLVYNLGVLHAREAVALENKEDVVRMFAEAANLFERAADMTREILPVGATSGCDFLDSNYLLAIAHTVRGYGYESAVATQMTAKAAPAMIAHNAVKAYRSFESARMFFGKLSETTDFYHCIWYSVLFRKHYFEVVARHFISQFSTPDNALKESTEAISLLDSMKERLDALEAFPIHVATKQMYEDVKKLIGVAGKKKPTAAAQLQDLDKFTLSLSDRETYSYELPSIYIPPAGRVMSEFVNADALQFKIIDLENKIAELKRLRDSQASEIRRLEAELENALAQPPPPAEEAQKEEVSDSKSKKGKKDSVKTSNKSSAKTSRRASVKGAPLTDAAEGAVQMPVLAERIISLAGDNSTDLTPLLAARGAEIERLQALCIELAGRTIPVASSAPAPTAVPALLLDKPASKPASAAPSVQNSARGKAKTDKTDKTKKGKKKGETPETSENSAVDVSPNPQKPAPAEQSPAYVDDNNEEIDALKAQLQERDDEIARLKEQLNAAPVPALPIAQGPPTNPPSVPNSARGKATKTKAEKAKKGKGKRGDSEASDSASSATASQIMSNDTANQVPVPAKPSKVLAGDDGDRAQEELEKEIATVRARNADLEAQLKAAEDALLKGSGFANTQPIDGPSAADAQLLAEKERELENLRKQIAKLEGSAMAKAAALNKEVIDYEKLFKERESELTQVRKLLVARDLEINRLKGTPGSDSILCLQKTEIERLRGELRARDSMIERLKRSVSSQEEAFTCLRNTVQEKDKEATNLRVAIKAQDQQVRSLLSTGTYNPAIDDMKYLPSTNVSSLETASRAELDNVRAELRDKKREVAKLREALMNSSGGSAADMVFHAEIEQLRKELQARDKTIAALTMRINAMDADTM